MEEMSEDWENCCPLCMEEMDSTDRQLKPCRCGYQICVWCWHHIMEMAEKDSTEGRCPACRTPYDKEKIVSTAVSCDRFGDMNEKKQRPGKAKMKAAEGRKNLSNVRVIQRNLVYVVGIPAALADEETLERKEYFGQYGKIFKISVSKTSGHSSQHSSAGPSVSVYVTYVKEEDALRCIQAVNGYMLEGKVLKACFGTTKYCNAWLKHMPCNNPDCLYLHDEGTREDSFTKEEMLAKYGSKNQHFHDLTHPPQRRSGIGLPPPVDMPSFTSASNVLQSVSQNAPSMVGSAPKAIALVGNLPKSSSLPAAASWGSRSSASSSRPVSSGRSGVIPVASKPKTGTGLITLATVSGSYASGQSSNNHDGVKHSKSNHTEGGQTSLAGASRLLERTSSATDPSVIDTDADDASADVDVSRQGLDGLISHKRNLSNAEANNHTFGTSKEIKLVEPSSFHKFADAEESGVGVDVLTGKGSSRIASLQETCEKSSIEMPPPLPVENSFLDQHESGTPQDTDIMLHGSLSMSNLDHSTNQELFTDSLTSIYEPEVGLQQGLVKGAEVHSRLQTHFLTDKGLTYANASDVSGQLSSNTSGLSILPRSDHAISSNSNYPTENFEDVQCNIPPKDPWSISMHPVNSEETASYTRDEATLPSEISSHAEQRAWKGETHVNDTSTKEPINGLSEHELISDMFSSDFDLWTDGSPQDLAQLLFNGKKAGSPSTTLKEAANSWKPSTGSKQSRFHFARQDEATEGMLLQASGNDRHLWTEKHNRTPSGNVSSSLGEVSTGEQFLSKLPASELYGGMTPSHLLNSKSPMMAPPGFSSRASAVPPPGFSQPKPPDSRRLAEVRHEPARSLAPSTIYNHLEAANSSADVEFIDPAIMAVGRGKLPAGSRPAIPFASSPLSAFLSQAAPLSQQPRPLDFDSSYQAHQDRPFRNYGSLNSLSQLGYSNQDLETASSSLFHSSFNDAINQPRLMGQYHDNVMPHVVMQDSVYGNGGHSASKLRFQHSASWDDWNRLSEGNSAGQQSVNDTVGRLAMSQLSLDRVLQSRLDELALSKDLGSKYFAEAAIPSGHDDQGPLNSARIGRYYLQH